MDNDRELVKYEKIWIVQFMILFIPILLVFSIFALGKKIEMLTAVILSFIIAMIISSALTFIIAILMNDKTFEKYRPKVENDELFICQSTASHGDTLGYAYLTNKKFYFEPLVKTYEVVIPLSLITEIKEDECKDNKELIITTIKSEHDSIDIKLDRETKWKEKMNNYRRMLYNSNNEGDA